MVVWARIVVAKHEYTRQESGDLNFVAGERIEVLNGPQGTLYGASTLGGLIKYVTNEPAAEPRAMQVMPLLRPCRMKSPTIKK